MSANQLSNPKDKSNSDADAFKSDGEKVDSDWQDLSDTSSSKSTRCSEDLALLPSTEEAKKEINDLPIGWIKQFDKETKRYFYFDPLGRPFLVLWHHPLDDKIGSENQKRKDQQGKAISIRVLVLKLPLSLWTFLGSCLASLGLLIMYIVTLQTLAEREEDDKILKMKKEKESKKRLRDAEDSASWDARRMKGLTKAKETGLPQYMGLRIGGQTEVWCQPPPVEFPWMPARVGNTPFMKLKDCTGPGYERPDVSLKKRPL